MRGAGRNRKRARRAARTPHRSIGGGAGASRIGLATERYAASKLANIACSDELARRAAQHGWYLASNAVHPGVVDTPRTTFDPDALVGPVLAPWLDRVLRLPSVASKRFLTNKVDRSVTGLIAQQQCVGPLVHSALFVASQLATPAS